MIVDKPRVKELFHSAIRELEKLDVTPTPEETVWLHHMACKAVTPEHGEAPMFCEFPVKVGRVWLYPLSIQASIWLERYAYKWWGHRDTSMDTLAMAYAMAHACKEKAFDTLTSKIKASVTIRAWAISNLFCSYRRLRQAVDMVLGDTDHVIIGDETEKPANNHHIDGSQWGGLVAMLCGSYHLPPEHFLYRISANTCAGMIRNAPTPMGYVKPDIDSTEVRAFMEFRAVVKEIKQRHENDNAREEKAE